MVQLAIKNGQLETLQWMLETFSKKDLALELGRRVGEAGQNSFHLAAEANIGIAKNPTNPLKALKVLQALHKSGMSQESLYTPDLTGKTVLSYSFAGWNDKTLLEWLLVAFPRRSWSLMSAGANFFHSIRQPNQFDKLAFVLEYHFDSTDIGDASNRQQIAELLLAAVKICHVPAINWILIRFPNRMEENLKITDNDDPGKIAMIDVLHHSLEFQDLNLLERLLTTYKGQWDWERLGSNGENAFHLAARHAHLKALQLLHDNCCGNVKGVFCPDSSGDTVLNVAARQGGVCNLEWLLETFPSAWKIDETDEKLFQDIMSRPKIELVRLLEVIRKHFPSLDLSRVPCQQGPRHLLHLAIANDAPLSIIQMLLGDCPSNWNLASPKTMVLSAVEHNRLDVLKVVQEKFHQWSIELNLHNYSPDSDSSDKWSAFHAAAKLGHAKMLKWFLDNFPAQWDAVTASSSCPSILHVATRNNHLNILEMFWESHSGKVDFFAKDSTDFDQTVLETAMNLNLVDIKKWFVATFHLNLTYDLNCTCEGCTTVDDLIQSFRNRKRKRKYPFSNESA